jgi:predicted aldo/keto reductase-like oxidoreductase
MRPMTSGILQRILSVLKPEWPTDEIYTLALQFVLADSRVDVLNVGMRWPSEVDQNIEVAERFRPSMDMAELPRLTAGIYRAEDDEAGARGTGSEARPERGGGSDS